jgi:ribosomal protein L37AE/L43A
MNVLLLVTAFSISEPPTVKGFTPDPPKVKGFVYEPPAVKGFEAKQKSVKVAAVGFHIHQCPLCGTEWSHSDNSSGDVGKHTCPSCNNVLPGNWMPSQRGMRIVESSYQIEPRQYAPMSFPATRYSFPSANR